MDTFDILERVRQSSGSSVLATVIAVEGHAYRKSGAAMVLHPSGETAGVISPGCLEDDLLARVPGVLESGVPEIVEYDMRPEEDPVWGEAVGCGGRVTILLEPLRGQLLQLLLEARRRTLAGECVVLERWRAGDRMAYHLVSAAARCGPRGEFHAAEFRPRTRLIMFGAGRDAPPLCRIAAHIGFQVVVADWRESLLSPERFPAASETVCGTPAEVTAKLAVRPSDFAVVCSHQLRQDCEMLARLLAAAPAYIGVMGSRKRIALLFERLDRTPNVHAPIGLNIGAEGPEEIAVSIAAELIASKAAWEAGGGWAHADRSFVFGRGPGVADGMS